MGFPDHEFEQLFSNNYDQLVRSLTAITGDRETALDCVQDAFVKASAKWRTIRRYDDPAGWVRRVAINRGRDIHRAEDRRRKREARARFLDGSQDIGDDVGIVDESVRLGELLRTLSPQQQAVAALFYVDDMSVGAIAETLGLSSGTVKFHLNQARASLRVVVEQQGQDDGHTVRRRA